MDYADQTSAAGRHLMPDLVRSFALFGIALVNVGVIAYSMDLSYFTGGYRTSLDTGASFLVNSIFMAKSYTLFAFMFGVGFAYQMKSAARAGAAFKARYMRRIIGLFVLGFVHIAFLFSGDILVVYAILGSFLFLFRNTSVKTTVKWGFVFLSIQLLIALLMGVGVQLGMHYAPDDIIAESANMQENAALSLQVFGSGSFAEATTLRVKEWTHAIGFILFVQGFGVFAFFLFGLAAVKSDIIANPKAALWRTFRRICLPIGLSGSVVGAALTLRSDTFLDVTTMWGIALIFIFAPLSSVGYLGLIAKWAARTPGPKEGKIRTFMARGGTATLTAYLMQSLILSFIFNAYGLGLYGKLGAAGCIAIAFGTALFTLMFSSLWRTKFTRGPLESLLRSWTYLGPR
jgi:uncharacterized protein